MCDKIHRTHAKKTNATWNALRWKAVHDNLELKKNTPDIFVGIECFSDLKERNKCCSLRDVGR